MNSATGTDIHVSYWRESDKEVDFVLQQGKSITAIEVKSGRLRENTAGMDRFSKLYRPQRSLLIGADGIPLSDFLRKPASDWVG